MPQKLSEVLSEKVKMNLTLGDVKPARLNEAVRKVHARFPPVDAPDSLYLQERLIQFLERLETRNWTGYKWSEASNLARDFFGSEFATDQQWEQIKNDFLDQLPRERKSFVRGCFNGYLGGFKERSSLTDQLASTLKKINPTALGQMSKFEQQFSALSPQGLPDRIVEEIVNHEKPYEKIREYGVKAPHIFDLFDGIRRAFT